MAALVHTAVRPAGYRRKQRNKGIYFDVYEIAKRNFAPFPNAVLVRGELPGTLDNVTIGKISYLSVDLNAASFEKASIEKVWDRVVPGAAIVLDDYAFLGHEEQNSMWDAAADHGQVVLTLPTGHGLIVKQ